MGRGRVQLKRIENKISRQVTFSKRRTGLLKKANEISLLCDADVALILFSTKGKLFEYSTHSSMEAILERYERCSYGEKLVMGPDAEITQGSWTLESSKLRTKIDLLQKNIRHYGGEDLESLNLRELQSIEQQLENALKRIRTKKNHVMHESISKLQKKERALQDRINAFSKKKQLKDDKKNNEPENAGFFLSQPSPVSPLPPQPPRDSFERTIDDSAQIHTISATMMPSWLYHHMNQ